MQMKVILRSPVPKLGAAGDVKRVALGFARNYLLPRGLAIPATEAALAAFKKGEAKRKAKADAEAKTAKTAAAKMQGVTLSFTRLAGEEGKIFGSVGKTDIVKSLKASGFDVDRNAVVLAEPIKAIGETEVEVKLHHDASAKVKVSVLARK